MHRIVVLALSTFALIVVAAVPASAQITTPARGSALRAEILDALRPSIEKETGPPVEFVIRVIHVMGPWAYVEAKPQRPGGQPIDWRRTRFRQDFEADMFSELALALLRRGGSGWQVVGTFIGPTDVAWYEWVEKYKLPERFFQPP